MRLFILFFSIIIFALNTSNAFAQNLICKLTKYSCPKVLYKQLIQRDNFYYRKFDANKYTGYVDGRRKGFMQDGVKEGIWEFYFNGKLKIKENLVLGERNGETKIYFNSGELNSKSNYKNGLKNGYYKTYYKSGKLRSISSYKNNKRIGESKIFYENGNILGLGLFENGNEEGNFILYTKKGDIKEGAFFKKGRLQFCFNKFSITKIKCDNFKMGWVWF